MTEQTDNSGAVQADASQNQADSQGAGGVLTNTGTADPAPDLNGAAAPLEMARDGSSEPAKDGETMTLAFDGEQIGALVAELKAHVDAGLADLRAEFRAELNELAAHMDKLDVGALEVLVEQANTAMARIAASPVQSLADRLTTLEAKAKHFF